MVKIRLQGSFEEIEEISRILSKSLQILEQLDDCHNSAKTKIMKRYMTVKKLEEDQGIYLSDKQEKQ